MIPSELAEIGRAVWGERWQSALARAIGVSDRTVRRWVAGDQPIPAGAAEEIVELLGRDRARQAIDKIAEIQREHRTPAEIRLTQGRDAVGRRATKILAAGLEALGVKVEIVPVDDATSDPAERAKEAAKR